MKTLRTKLCESDVQKLLVPYNDYSPYPKIEDRSFWEGLCTELKDKLISKGEKYLEFIWESVPASTYLEYYRSGNRSCNESVMFKKRMALGSLVMAECTENKGRFTDDIINGLWSICEESSWAVSAHIEANGRLSNLLPDCVNDAVLDLFALETAQLMAFSNYVIKEIIDKVTPIISARIVSELQRRIFIPYIKRNDCWWMGFSGKNVNNWAPWCTSNILISAMLTCTNNEIRACIINKAIDTLDIFMNLYPEDGSCDEGTSYWYKAGGALIDAVDVINKAVVAENNLFDDRLIKNISEFIIKARIDNLYYFNFADGSAIINNTEPASIFHMGELFGDEIFKQEGAYLAKISGDIIEYASWYSPHKVMLGIKYYAEIRKYKGNPPCDRDTWWQGIEVLLAREYEEYGKGFVLVAKGGHNNESHNHNDVGNVVVYHNGRPILIDAGVGEYTAKTFSNKRYEIWTMRSSYHNLPVIDGYEEREGMQFTSLDTECTINSLFSELKMDLKNAYPKDAGIEKWIRTSKLDRMSGSIIINENFKLNSSKKVQFIFMCAYKPIIANNMIQISNCMLEVSSDINININYEVIEMTDEKLIKVWGKSLYRIFIDCLDEIHSANLSFSIFKA